MTCKCETEFETSTHNKAKRHCSRSCASYYSMSPERRKAMSDAGERHKDNLIPVHEVLKRREGWKYVAVREALGSRPHDFEFELGGFVYDLALFDTKTLVEFDGPEHCGKVAEHDRIKDALAHKLGWRIERRKVKTAEVIHPETLGDL